MLIGPLNHRPSTMHLKFLANVGYMPFHGIQCHVQLARDLTVAMPKRHELQHLTLTSSEVDLVQTRALALFTR
jgi:hypothetical protein